MKKKILVAFFAAMSVASMNAYFIQINNKSKVNIKAALSPYDWTRDLRLKPGEKKRFRELFKREAAVAVWVDKKGGWRGSLVIPKDKLGRTITIDVVVEKGAPILSLSK